MLKRLGRLPIGALSGAIVCISSLACAHRAPTVARLAPGSVTGRAAAALDDSGLFTSPVLPRGVRPVIPTADAESAGVAMGYWGVPSYQDRTVAY
jgi:hypothetical protein